ncbi:ribitolphosphotransferase [Lactiplantibacillus garii]|uniref:Ribitolphosphotransferase n=1 Tax=Lactiplantibacillus garii TaxID=2306423 RepID=A0A3R8J7R8_9LACO|nr:CDP-glycerol glycerophosphotransferase family protein [Lactiplantibacillus garii]RRK10458.1 ribitolphosphotransferase [Lactiplantibacillus garii]
MGRLNLKKIKLNLLRLGFNWFYQLSYHVRGPQKQRVSFVTMRSARLNDNLKALHAEFARDGRYQLKVLCFQYDRTWKSKLGFLVAALRTLWLLATSKLLIIDDYCLPLYAVHKHPENQVVQLWHAVGALKKFGLSLPTASRSVIKPHTNYDWVFINTPADKFAYVDAFDVDPDHVLVNGEPMVDQLMRQRPLQHTGAKRLLYSPTYRPGARGTAQVLAYVQQLVRSCQQLTGVWDVYVSLHPYLRLPVLDLPANVHVFQDAARVRALMPTIDLFVTDYSSLSLSFSHFERPIVLYTPDYDAYVKTSGFYVDYYDYLDVPHFESAERVVAYVNADLANYDLGRVRRLNAKTFTHQDGHNAQRVFQYLTKLT